MSDPKPHGEQERKNELFTREDIRELIQTAGFQDQNSYFCDEEAYRLLEEMGNHFIEEILDTFHHKKK